MRRLVLARAAVRDAQFTAVCRTRTDRIGRRGLNDVQGPLTSVCESARPKAGYWAGLLLPFGATP